MTRSAKTVLYNRYVTPLMSEHGFAGERRIYRRFNDHGDCVLVEFQPSTWSRRDEYHFYVVLCVALRSHRELQANAGLAVDFDKPDQTSGLDKRLCRPVPGSLASHDFWVIDTVESAHSVGAELVGALRPWLAELTGMLNRENFLDRLRSDREYPFGSWRGRDYLRTLLLAEQGMSEELAELLRGYEEAFRYRVLGDDEDEETAASAEDPFVAWLRDRARQRETAGG